MGLSNAVIVVECVDVMAGGEVIKAQSEFWNKIIPRGFKI